MPRAIRRLPAKVRIPVAGALFFVGYVALRWLLTDQTLLSAIVAGAIAAVLWTVFMARWERRQASRPLNEGNADAPKS